MKRRKDSLKRYVARAYRHLEKAIDEFYNCYTTSVDVNIEVAEVFSLLAQDCVICQKKIVDAWECLWGEFPRDIATYAE